MNKQQFYIERAEKAREMIKAGMGNTEIAVSLDMKPNNVAHLRSQLGIDSPTRSGRPKKPVKYAPLMPSRINVKVEHHKGFYKGKWIEFDAQDITPIIIDCGEQTERYCRQYVEIQ